MFKLFIQFILLINLALAAEEKIVFSNEPLDVVIPCIEKDLDTLERCIKGVRENCDIRHIYVISNKKLTNEAEWVDEALFPFTLEDIAFFLMKEDQELADQYLKTEGNRVGWYYQQLLKFYSHLVIPEISSNILILDADTIILNPTEFLNDSYGGLYNFDFKPRKEYFDHAKRLTNGYVQNPLYPLYSGITHHMVFQKSVLEELFALVENYHQKEFWKAFCLCINLKHIFAGASEYEIYFNFVFRQTKDVGLQYLLWKEIDKLRDIPKFKKKGYHYVTCHSHRRS